MIAVWRKWYKNSTGFKHSHNAQLNKTNLWCRNVYCKKWRVSSCWKDLQPTVNSHYQRTIKTFIKSIIKTLSSLGFPERHLLISVSEHLGITPLTQKQIKNPKNSAIMDHVLLESHNTTYHNFSVLMPNKNRFKLHRKDSVLIGRDKIELSRNSYIFPLERFV